MTLATDRTEPSGAERTEPSGAERTEPRDGRAQSNMAADGQVEAALDRTIEEGRNRLSRGWRGLVATGIVGGLDVGSGVLALLLVEHLTGSKVLGGLAFAIGFIALTLAQSELFTEDFLVPVIAVVARRAGPLSLVRLWAVTLVSNLLGGWVVTALIIAGLPSLREEAVRAGSYYVELGLGWRAFALALLGGMVITLMTWMQHSTDSLGTRLVPAVTTGFLLAGAQLNHAIVNSLLMFAALHTGHAPFGYLEWLQTASWAALGNLIGGVGLVTVLRLLQVPEKVGRERRKHGPG